MLEIFIVGYLARNISALSIQKGLKGNRWKAYAILLWIGLELIGLMANFVLFGGFTLFSVLLIYGLPTVGYLVLRQNLKNRPDVMDDWISQIGTDSADPLPAPVTKE